MTKKRTLGVYVTPDFEIEVIRAEAGFALSVETEDFGSYGDTTLGGE
jgi:hypothetical protein